MRRHILLVNSLYPLRGGSEIFVFSELVFQSLSVSPATRCKVKTTQMGVPSAKDK